MDTKLTKFRYSYLAKIIALVLVFVFALCAVISAGIFVKNVSLYGGTKYLSAKDTSDIFSAAAFYDNISYNMKLLCYDSGIYTYEQHFAELETKGEALERAARAYDEYTSSDEATTLYRSDSDYYSDDTEATTASYSQDGSNPNILVGIVQIGTSSSNYTVSAAEYGTKEAFLKEFAKQYDLYLVAEKRAFSSLETSKQQTIDSFVNLKYIVVNTKTGQIASNLDNAGELLSNGTAVGEFSSKAWYLVYSASDGAVAYSDKYMNEFQQDSSYYSMEYLLSIAERNFAESGLDLYLYIQTPLAEGDNYYNISQDMVGGRQNAVTLTISCAAFLLLTAATALYLFFVCGHKGSEDDLSLALIDKIPNDIHLLLSGGAIFGILYCACSIADNFYNNSISYSESDWIIVAVSLLVCAAGMVLLEWLLSVTRHIKFRRSFIKNTICYRIIRWVFKKIIIPFCKWIAHCLSSLFRPKFGVIRKRALWAIILFIIFDALMLLFSFFTVNAGNGTLPFILFFLTVVAACVFFMNIWGQLSSLDKIILSSKETRDGVFTPIPDIQKMPEPMKTLAQNLQFVQEGMKKAVDEAVKGERMKTELITNVSHDLKTPLTSIINYVDLLKKSDIDDIQAQQYIDVLSDKANRLKRLIEDLVEASKASSGNVVLNKMPVNLYELSVQAIGESEDDFAVKNLEIKLNEAEEPVTVFADSQKTWRIIDNLLTNARKYSMPMSRVYVNVSKDENYGYFTIKNISVQALDISPEELTQRFVRGDESRAGEGSGLGLSIARDLCVLQGGELEISIDGDLFKATVKLPVVTPQPEI